MAAGTRWGWKYPLAQGKKLTVKSSVIDERQEKVEIGNGPGCLTLDTQVPVSLAKDAKLFLK